MVERPFVAAIIRAIGIIRGCRAVGGTDTVRKLPGVGETDAELTLVRLGEDGTVRARFDLR